MAIRSFALATNLGRCQNTAKIDFMFKLKYIVLHSSLLLLVIGRALSASNLEPHLFASRRRPFH